MIAPDLIHFFERDLAKLKEEILLYKNENDLWKVKEGIRNSSGNLSLHLAGNLKHFIGAILGKSGYVRQRDKEFSDKNIPRTDMIKSIDETIGIIKKTLSTLDDKQCLAAYPEDFLGNKRSVLFVLTQLAVHLDYHLGQINYHRRLLTS